MTTEQEEAKFTLHWLESSRAQRILWLLDELSVPYEIKIYHRQKGTNFAPEELQKAHPLGKSPVLTVERSGVSEEPLVLAESGFVVQYLCEHYGQGSTLVPAKWKPGQEGQLGGETAAWMRYSYLLHYAEGSLMPYLLVYLVLSNLKGPQVPWLIRLITGVVVNKVNSMYTVVNIRLNLQMLESFIAEPPAGAEGSGYMCGGQLTAADILLSYPLLAARQRASSMGSWTGGSAEAEFPKLFAYIDRLEKEPGYVKAVEKIRALEGKFTLVPTVE